jgi:hypothetical protein
MHPVIGMQNASIFPAGGKNMRTASLTELKTWRVLATDGEIGSLHDLFVDDSSWLVRYLVIRTGGLLQRHEVLIAPYMAQVQEFADGKVIRLDATKDRIEHSPAVDTDPPVSRQEEINLGDYYRWDNYWASPLPPGALPYTEMGRPEHAYLRQRVPTEWLRIMERHRESFDPHLYSLDEIRGYKIGTRDDQTFGEYADMVIDTDVWRVDDFVLRSRKWLPGGREFICSPAFVERINTDEHVVGVMFTKEVLAGCPAYSRENYGESIRIATVRHLVATTPPEVPPGESEHAADQPGS